MNDLLNEKDFVQSKSYNPWKRFLVFYGIAFLNMEAFYFILRASYIKSLLFVQIASILSASLFLALPFLMIFHTRKNIHLKQRTIYKGVGLLMLTYFLTNHILEFFNNPYYFSDLQNNIIFTLKDLSIYVFYGLLSSFLITVIIKRKIKNAK